MNVAITRRIDPYAVSVTIDFNDEDISRGYDEQADPDEQSFMDLFSKKLKTRPPDEVIEICLRAARLVLRRQAAVLEGAVQLEERGT